MKGLLALLLALPALFHAQNYVMNGTPITNCSGTFYDPGGPNGVYGNNLNLSTTICSDGSDGTHIRLSFSGVDLAPGDVLCFYDGPNAAAPLLACAADYPPGQPFVVQATAANAGGCLTVVFQSNASGVATGWSAAISCVRSCQSVLADIVSSLPAPQPADTGWIDICPGTRVFFNGMGIYPQNNFSYAQSDLTTTFEWNFGDGGIAYGPNTSHRFDQAGGYFVQLLLTDTLGCKSTNLISQRIRVAKRPDFDLTGVSQICAGDTLHLIAGFDTSLHTNTVVVQPQTISFSAEASRADSLALPDGTGELYETSIFLTEFSPGQILTNAADLEHICVNIEHSWMRDIEITLTCPSGQSIILHDHPGNFGGEVFLGEPNDNDNFNPVPGLGYDYCWTPNAPNPTWIEYANLTLGASGSLPPGDYSTYDPISDLIGCPLNGEWTIGVVDLWPIDNGYIFNWSIKFNDALYPNIEMFTPQFVSWNWSNHPSIYSATDEEIYASPANAGTAGYTFTVTDEFGCMWDTLLSVAVLPPTHPDCYKCQTNYPALPDTLICASETIQYNATSLIPPTQEVRFEAYPDYAIGNANHPHANPYLSAIDVNSLGFNFLTNPIQQITSVCMDIETDFDGDLNVFLRAPNGQQMMLTTGNGGAGDNYKITCFSPTATLPIVGQAAPFNGTYIPEGSWNGILGSAMDGDWSLVVSDGFAPAQFGKLKWWSIGFNAVNTTNYSWANAGSLSCNNCPNPVATPTGPENYILTATDSHNCVHVDTATVNFLSNFPAPTGLSVFELGINTMTWVWDAVPGALGYQVSVDNGPWISPNNGLLSHIISGVAVGQTVNIAVRAISPSACVPAIANATSTFPVCTMFAQVFLSTDVPCAGDTTGTAILSVSNATSPVQFFLDNNPSAFPNGDFINILSGGMHEVIVLDAQGCRDTVPFTINEPPAIVVSPQATDVLCNGDDSGTVTVTATGGTGTIAFAWRDCLGGPTLGGPTQVNLFAGCYAVTATDANGCTTTASVTVNEPAPYQFNATQDSVSCAGVADGMANVVVSGGILPYTYAWDNGDATAMADSLTAGFHFVTVTDFNNCAAATFVQVLEPQPFIVTDITPQNATCFGGDNGRVAVTMSGGTMPWSYLWSDAAAQTTSIATALASGTYTVTVTDANGCTNEASAVVNAPPQMTLAFINVQNEQCAGDCSGMATATPGGGVGGYTYNWDNPVVPDVAAVSNLCPGIYVLILSDANGCTVTDQVIIAPALPINVQVSTTPPSCVGLQDATINVMVDGGVPPYGFQWSNGATTEDLIGIACGPYVLSLLDDAGCTSLVNVDVDCPQNITVNSVVGQDVHCFGGNDGTLQVNAQGGANPLQYVWSDPAHQTSANATGLIAGTYTVTISDANGCSTTAGGTVGSPTQLLAVVTHTDASCLNFADGTATAAGDGGIAPYTYNWGAPGTTPTISNLAAGTFVVTVTDANSCTATASVTIGQPATAVSVTATQTRRACWGETDGEASVSASGGNGAPFVFEWSNGQTGGGASNLATGLYTVTATDANGCTGVQTVAIQQLDSIEIKVAYAPPTCAGYNDGIVAVALVEGGLGMGDTTQYQYQWSLPGAPDATIAGGFSGGTYTLVVTDFQGCSGSLEFEVVAPMPLEATLAIQDVSCYGGTDGTMAVTQVANATGTVQYLWSNAATTSLVDNLGTGTYRVTVTDSKGCTDTAGGTIMEPAPLTLSFESTTLLCSYDQNATLTATVNGGSPIYTYNWNTGVSTETITGLSPGNYILTVTDRNGCEVVDSTLITAPAPIVIQPTLVPPNCWGGFDGRIALQVSGGFLPYRYSINGGDFGGSSVFIALGAGQYTILVRDANGCIAADTVDLLQPQPIEVSVGIDTTIILGDSLLLSAVVNNTVGLTTYDWSGVIQDSIHCVNLPECDEVWVKPEFSNIYRLKVTDENGCMGTAEVRVAVEKPRGVYVPTAFTPNGDVQNDLLVVHGKQHQVLKVRTFRVYDRWGEMLYEDREFSVNDLNRGWDGSFRNQPCDPGVYVWTLEAEYVDGFTEILRGNVTLIR